MSPRRQLRPTGLDPIDFTGIVPNKVFAEFRLSQKFALRLKKNELQKVAASFRVCTASNYEKIFHIRRYGGMPQPTADTRDIKASSSTQVIHLGSARTIYIVYLRARADVHSKQSHNAINDDCVIFRKQYCESNAPKI